jgi:adenylylsulfate kinase-like enzyme
MTITITGERGEGKSTLAKLLVYLLKVAGYKATVQDAGGKDWFASLPADLEDLQPRNVTIIAT